MTGHINHSVFSTEDVVLNVEGVYCLGSGPMEGCKDASTKEHPGSGFQIKGYQTHG